MPIVGRGRGGQGRGGQGRGGRGSASSREAKTLGNRQRRRMQWRPPPGLRSKEDCGSSSKANSTKTAWLDELPQTKSTSQKKLGSLGTIDGTYEIDSSDLDGWPMYSSDEFELILCVHGSTIWGAYDFGMHSSILHMTRRPSQASSSRIPFIWRGRENGEGQMSLEPGTHGWIRFLGGVKIEGMINCYGKAQFTGDKANDTDAELPRSAMEMKQEWAGYNHEEYERKRVGRWH